MPRKKYKLPLAMRKYNQGIQDRRGEFLKKQRITRAGFYVHEDYRDALKELALQDIAERGLTTKMREGGGT